MVRNNPRGYRAFVRAFNYNVFNPFAQVQRFTPYQNKHKKLTSQSDLPDKWKTPPAKKAIGKRASIEPSKDVPKIVPAQKKLKMSEDRVATVQDDDADMEMAVNLMGGLRTGGVVNSGGAHETPITSQRPHYGLPNTVTAVLPWTGYFSMISPNLKSDPATRFTFRLTSIFDIFKSTIQQPSPGTYVAGLWQREMNANSTATWPSVAPLFPSSMSAGANVVADCPQWRTYYTKMYQYYAVLGCEYEITFHNPQTNAACDQVIATYVDTYSAQSAANVHPSNSSVEEMSFWPDVNIYVAKSDGDLSGNNYTVIKGTYRPGQAHINVENDEDIKTWTKTQVNVDNRQYPALTEEMVVCMNKAWANDTSSPNGCNVRLKLRYIVQFKDLVGNYRWPATTQTAISVTAPTDIFWAV